MERDRRACLLPCDKATELVCMFQVVSVTFDELRLEEGDVHCSFDSLTLHDGFSAESPSLGKFCSSLPTSPVRSSGPSIFVLFQSDDSTHEGRFSLSWTIVDQGSQGKFLPLECLRYSTLTLVVAMSTIPSAVA